MEPHSKQLLMGESIRRLGIYPTPRVPAEPEVGSVGTEPAKARCSLAWCLSTAFAAKTSPGVGVR